MVDPAVLEASGIDSRVYSGFAFGMGVERITMLKYQIETCAHSSRATCASWSSFRASGSPQLYR